MVLKRKRNSAQIKRYREPLNIGRTVNAKWNNLYNLRVREGTTHSKETQILTIRSDASATSKTKRRKKQSQNEPLSQRVKEEATEKTKENQPSQADVIINRCV